MSEKITAIRRSFRQDALKFLNGRNEETVEVKLNQWRIEGADSKDTLQYVESFLAKGTTINFEGKVKTAQKQICQRGEQSGSTRKRRLERQDRDS